jgi:hypothetical protein
MRLLVRIERQVKREKPSSLATFCRGAISHDSVSIEGRPNDRDSESAHLQVRKSCPVLIPDFVPLAHDRHQRFFSRAGT